MKTRSGNIITMTDSYKVSHWRQYPKKTTRVFSFFESRGGVFPEITFFGLQYFLKKYLIGKVVSEKKIREAKKYFQLHFGDASLFNEDGWKRILTHHNGMLPIVIKAVPEGTTVPVSNVLMTVENTDPELPWLTNYLETLLSQVWYTSTVCTQSRAMKQLLIKALEETGNPDLIDFKLHDFGFRGSTSVESAGIGGCAHLVNFMGTDTFAAIEVAHDYYGETMAGFSIPAAEHSTITSWGRENEEDAYRNMLESFPSGLIAVVSDSYDIFNACKEIWGKKLKKQILERNGTLVVRPDSGNPPEVVVKVLNILGKSFGYSVNKKGFKVLNDRIRVIQGDGIDYNMIVKIMKSMTTNGWSMDNVAFGSGGGLLQKVNRDTQKFAFKCSSIEVDGEWRPVFKDPITDSGKRSKAGRLVLVKEGGEFKTVCENESSQVNVMETVFKDGMLLKDYRLSEIRERAKLS